MRKSVIVLGSLITAAALFLMGSVLFFWLNPPPEADQTDNYDYLVHQPENWQRFVDRALVTKEEMAVIDGSTATIPITAELYRQFFPDDPLIAEGYFSISHSKTHEAYMRLLKKDLGYSYDPVDLIFVTPPSAEERKEAAEMGIILDMKPVAKDGFVFITHKNNPIDSLTVEQVQGIYSGEITNWKELGGPNQAIIPYQRNENSGSQTAMEQLVMKGKAMLEPMTTRLQLGMGGMVDAVAEYENGPASIGYTYHYYLNNLYRNENVKTLKINGVAPTNDNLRNGAYPFSTDYYAVVRADEPEDSPARKIRDFLLTPTGQDVIAQAGYCKVVE